MIEAKKQGKIVSYRPSDLSMAFINGLSKPGSILSMTGVIEVAVRFLSVWPEEELSQIIGNSVSQEKLKAWVKDYLDAKEISEEP